MKINQTQARRIALLLDVLDEAREWRESFDETKRNYVGFDNIVSADNLGLNGERGGWDGAISLPKELAIEMMRWLEARAMKELTELGVSVDFAEPQG